MIHQFHFITDEVQFMTEPKPGEPDSSALKMPFQSYK